MNQKSLLEQKSELFSYMHIENANMEQGGGRKQKVGDKRGTKSQ